MRQNFTITDIDYDVDTPSEKEALPKTMEIEVELSENNCYEDVENFISEEISNRTGYCHKGFATTPKIETLFD